MGNYFTKKSSLFNSNKSIFINKDSLFEPLVDEHNIVERVGNLEDNVKLLSDDIHAIRNYLLSAHQDSSK